MNPIDLTRQIRNQARQLGFDAVGCASAEAIAGQRFDEWIERGYHGEMGYLARNRKKRLDPSEIVPNARSVLCLALNYRHDYELPYQSPECGVVSRYASGDDYHEVLKKRLQQLLSYIQQLSPGAQGRYYVDTGPVLDKHWASQSGLGWLGKHTNLLSREAGSWFFLGEILLDIELDYDQPGWDFCGSCTRCIEACPTGAIVDEYLLDSRRCISYLSIELRNEIPEEFRQPMGNLVFGCDICQDVCPWNRKAPLSSLAEFAPREINRAPDLRRLSRLTQEDFSREYSKSPIKRTKWRGLMRNVAVAMGNSGDPDMLADLRRLAQCGDELVESHAEWAIEQIEEKRGFTSCQVQLEPGDGTLN